MSTGSFVQEMLVLYGIALVGFLARKWGVLKENTNEVLTQLILYITLPALILFSLDIPFSFTLITEFFWLVVMSAYVLALSCLIASWMRRRSKLPVQQQSVYEGLIIFGNQGFIGYAVIFILFGEPGIVYLTIFNVFYLFLIWSYGIYLFTRNNGTIKLKSLFLNPGILSTCLGVLLLLLPIGWPPIISNGLEMVGKMTVPLSMMIIGSLIANVKLTSFYLFMKNSALWKIVVTKLLVIPFMLIPFAILPVPFTLLVIAVVVSGMPSASTITLYAQKYGGDAFFGSIAVLLTTLLSMFSIPFLYWMVSYLFS